LPPSSVRSKAAAAEPKSYGETDESARIARIENGLLPAVAIKGQPTPTMAIADQMKHYHVPGVSIAFFGRGRILWTRTYGFADVANKIPVATETLFQAASISKPVSALAALRLVQEGKLRLDDDVNAKLHSWRLPENEFTKEQQVTLRRILSHSAGLTVHGFPGYAAGEPLPTVVQILNGEKPANNEPVRVDVVPGTIERYSGGGYVLMQLLLTDVVGKPYPQLLHDLVLEPAGMTHSTYEQPLPGGLSSVATTPYRGDGEPVKGGWHTYPEMAAAGLWTTPSDLALLAIEVQKEHAGKSNKILSQEMMRQMLTHQKDDVGLGFFLESAGHARRFGHTGSNEGFNCDLEAYIKSGQGLAIMTNSENAWWGLIPEIFRAVAKEYDWPDYRPVERTIVRIDPALLSIYSGTYEAPGEDRQTVTTKGGKAYIQADPIGPEPVELFPESDTRFFTLVNSDVSIVFQKDEKGAATKLIIRVGSRQVFEYKKRL